MQPPILKNPDAIPAVLLALRMLISANNTNYQRDTMRYAGLFRQAASALEAATGERVVDNPNANDPLVTTLQQIVGMAETIGKDASWREQARALAAIRAVAETALDPTNW